MWLFCLLYFLRKTLDVNHCEKKNIFLSLHFLNKLNKKTIFVNTKYLLFKYADFVEAGTRKTLSSIEFSHHIFISETHMTNYFMEGKWKHRTVF